MENKMIELHVKVQLTRDVAAEVKEKIISIESSIMHYHTVKMKEINQTL